MLPENIRKSKNELYCKIAGTLLLVGTTQFIVAITVAEVVYPNYSMSANFISDLGLQPTSAIFNSSLFLTGLMVL